MTRVWADIKPRTAYLQHLSVVFADELRQKIVTELYMREMSPEQFYDEFGGGSVSAVDLNFKRLADFGWLRLVRTESGGHRRDGVEHFYRATELAVFDRETWCLMPHSMRVAISWRTFKQLAERVREALEAGTLDARPNSYLSWTPIRLDQLGWERVAAAIDALFESLFEEQADAKLRIVHSKETPILATVALIAFESPARLQEQADGRVIPRLVESRNDSPVPFPVRLSKVFADEICLRIITETNLREMSAPQFHAEFGGGSIDGVRRRFKMLAEMDWLRKVDEETDGGHRSAAELFYKATSPAIFDNESWADVPDSIKTASSWVTFTQLSDHVKEAIETGTLEARLDNHLSWSLLLLDQEGWEKVTAAVDGLFAFVIKERAKAKDRLAASGEKPVAMTVALVAFESPRNAAKEA